MISCGIDFGTSNSALAIANKGEVTLARVEGQSQTMPSAVFFHSNGDAAYGRDAMRSFFEGDEGRFIRSFKRTLGTYLVEYGAIINGRLRRFDHIIAGYVRALKIRAEADQKCDIESVVMGRPVHFVDGDDAANLLAQKQLEDVAKLVGFKNIAFQYEPIAAAFAHEQKIEKEQLALVVDIGGGTSDFTVIRLSKDSRGKTDRSSDILSNGGIRLGGNDFDKTFCLKDFMPSFGYNTTYGERDLLVPLTPFHDMSEWSKVNGLYVAKMRKQLKDMLQESNAPALLSRFVKVVEEETGYKVLSAVEESKIGLTSNGSVAAPLGFIEEGFAINTDRDSFNISVHPHVDRILEQITDCLAQAGVTEDKIQLVILTGGTTEVPLLQNAVKNRFPDAAISEENKLSSVGFGLGYDSLRRFG